MPKASLLLLLAVGVMLFACSGQGDEAMDSQIASEAVALGRASSQPSSEEAEESIEPRSLLADTEEPSAPPANPPPTLTDEEVLGREDLLGLGEMGALPNLLQALTPGSGCDFDDTLGACQ